MIVVKAGTIINGPNGQGYKILRDIHKYDLVASEDFQPFGGAPAPKAGEQIPDWAYGYIRGVCR